MTHKIYREGLPPVPRRMRHLKVDARGYPVPMFVSWINGEPDFRVSDGKHMAEAMRFDVCWVCGQKLGSHRTYIVGPMCVVNRVSSEPPSHAECAHFSAKACPFLANPKRGRNPNDLPEEGTMPGCPIMRNPGVVVIYTTKATTRPFSVENGVLYELGEPTTVEWVKEGRAATLDECLEAIETGYPALLEVATEAGPRDVAALKVARERAMLLLPGGRKS